MIEIEASVLSSDFLRLGDQAREAEEGGVVEEVLDVTDIIQVMTVNPGFGGQKFIHSQLDKISRLREMLEKHGYESPIAVDGGIDTITAPLVVKAGATVLVAGSSIYNERASVARNVTALRESIKTEKIV